MRFFIRSVIIYSVLFSLNNSANGSKLYAMQNSNDRLFLAKEDNDIEEKNIKENINNKKDKIEYRQKYLYASASIGYFLPKNNMNFYDMEDCGGPYNADFICNSRKDRPISATYDNNYFLSAAFGINSETFLRFEFSYLQLLKKLNIEGVNRVGVDNRKYFSNIKLNTSSINVYFDFINRRNEPYSVFVPYMMAGIGLSNIRLNDFIFTGTMDKKYTVFGKKQENKTIIYGFGLTAGINSYISMDIGYRYYDFDTIKTDIVTQEEETIPGPPPSVNINNFDIGLKSHLRANTIIITGKIQI